MLTLPSVKNLSGVIRDIKANSSRHLRTANREFGWQDGYAGISVRPSRISGVRKYIQNQEEHHRKARFEDEYLLMLQWAGARFDISEIFD